MTRTKQKAAGPREARANGQQNTTIAAAEQVPSLNSPHMNFGKSQSRRSNPGPISKGERRVQNERAAAVAHPRPHLLPFSVSDMLTAIHKQYFSTIQGVLSLYFVTGGPLAYIRRRGNARASGSALACPMRWKKPCAQNEAKAWDWLQANLGVCLVHTGGSFLVQQEWESYWDVPKISLEEAVEHFRHVRRPKLENEHW